MTIDVSNVHVFTQNNIRIETQNAQDKKVVYFDVYGMETEPHDADILFITHDHYDHYSPENARKVMKEDTIVIVPQPLIEKSKQIEQDPGSVPQNPNEPAFESISVLGASQVVGVSAGDSFELEGIAIEVVPAYNVRPERQGCHPKKDKGVGYVVTIEGVRYYIAGDTDQNPENSTVTCDVMLVPVGGTFTCDPKEAAVFVNDVHPKVAIPTHYGSIAGQKSNGDEFAQCVDEGISVIKKLPY